MRESAFWGLIKAAMHRVCPVGMHFSRIENISGSGVPDVNMCKDGREMWIELKIARGNQVLFQPSQLAWITQHVACGGNVFVLVRKNNEMRLYLGADAVHLAKKLDVAPVFVTQKPFRWRELIDLLVELSK